jgi:phospholipid/cholesterol/gamma-HCH transport system permease protein
LLDQVISTLRPPPPLPRPVPGYVALLLGLGQFTIGMGARIARMLNFFGLLLVTIAGLALRPHQWRTTSMVFHMKAVGVDAMPIVGLMSFLIGVVLAYQGASQLQRFGAEVFTVNLIALSVLREIGILMTAILVAGRSGSAFTAAIGSMKLREEIDAMRTLGLDPMEVLVLPRVIALIIMVPILGFIAAMMGLTGGGLVVWLTMGMSPEMYIERLYGAADFWDGAVAFIKAPVFGLMIGMIGCYEGMKVEGSAESVGQRTTASVVESIFTVIVVDAVFSILFVNLGI